MTSPGPELDPDGPIIYHPKDEPTPPPVAPQSSPASPKNLSYEDQLRSWSLGQSDQVLPQALYGAKTVQLARAFDKLGLRSNDRAQLFSQRQYFFERVRYVQPDEVRLKLLHLWQIKAAQQWLNERTSSLTAMLFLDGAIKPCLDGSPLALALARSHNLPVEQLMSGRFEGLTFKERLQLCRQGVAFTDLWNTRLLLLSWKSWLKVTPRLMLEVMGFRLEGDTLLAGKIIFQKPGRQYFLATNLLATPGSDPTAMDPCHTTTWRAGIDMTFAMEAAAHDLWPTESAFQWPRVIYGLSNRDDFRPEAGPGCLEDILRVLEHWLLEGRPQGVYVTLDDPRVRAAFEGKDPRLGKELLRILGPDLDALVSELWLELYDLGLGQVYIPKDYFLPNSPQEPYKVAHTSYLSYDPSLLGRPSYKLDGSGFPELLPMMAFPQVVKSDPANPQAHLHASWPGAICNLAVNY